MPAPRTLAAIYAALALLAVLLLAPLMPPLQNADEAAHAFRADQVSHLGMLGIRIPDSEFGGDADTGLAGLARQTASLQSAAGRVVTREAFRPLPWGRPAPIGYPNTAINPPFFYLPAALAAAATRWRGVGLPHALVLMRLATGVTTVAVGALAIAMAGSAAVWFYAVLLLPMSMSVSAAVSQDGPMLACTALAVALLLYLRRPGPARPRLAFAGLCALLAAIAMSRSPYLAFAVLLLAAPVRPSWRAAGLFCVVVPVLAWTWRGAQYLPVPLRPDSVVVPSLQLRLLLGHPWRVPLLVVRTLAANDGLIGRSFIGQLGWLDIGLPSAYRDAAWACLGLALWLCVRRVRGAGDGPSPRVLAGTLVAAAGAVAGVGLAQYMTWTVVGSPVVEGIQGRYFLPPALLLGALGQVQAKTLPWLAAPVLLFPVASIAVTVHAVILRYYV